MAGSALFPAYTEDSCPTTLIHAPNTSRFLNLARLEEDITTIGELCARSEKDLRKMPFCNDNTIRALKRLIELHLAHVHGMIV